VIRAPGKHHQSGRHRELKAALAGIAGHRPDEAECEALWGCRRGAFAAVTRLAPSYLSMDGTVPRTKLPEALRRVAEIDRRYGFEISCVLHAGDGNLHPVALFDDRDDSARKNAEAASLDILRMCVELGGTVSGEHGIGIEKLEAMHFVFDDNDLRAQGFAKDAFDPGGLSNPGKVLPDPVTRAGSAGRSGRSARSEAAADA